MIYPSAQSIVTTLYQRGARLAVEEGALVIDAADEVLDDDVIAALRQHKPAIISLLQALEAGAAAPLSVAARPGAYSSPVSLAQQRMLFMEELAGGHSYYNIPVAYEITGPLDQAALSGALAALVATHDILRTVYVPHGQSYLQRIDAPAPLAIGHTDLTRAADQDAALAALLADDAAYRFRLQEEWPIRAAIVTLAPQRHVLSINIHHIAADGRSARRIVDDLGAAYRALRGGAHGAHGAHATPPARPPQYADYVEAQQVWLASDQYQAARHYWTKALHGAPELHSLPTDFIRPAVQSTAGDTYVRALPAAVAAAVRAAAQASGTTPFVIFQCAFAALLARYSGETDIVFGTAAANRQPSQFADAVGLFVNTLALRYDVADQLSFQDLIEQGRQVSAQAFRHQQLPFDVLVDELQPARSLGYNPLVQLMLVMQEGGAALLQLDGATVRALPQRQQVSKFDLALHIDATAEGYCTSWEFNTTLFKRDTIDAMCSHFERLLAACLANPRAPVGGMALVDAAGMPQAGHAPAVCIERWFAAHAQQAPHAAAILDGDRTFSYAQLEQRAAALATHLLHAGAGPAARIGVCMEKCAELVISMMAIFRIGAVYVPLDPHYPRERLAFMVEDSRMQLMLAGPDNLAAQLAHALPTLDVHALAQPAPGVILPPPGHAGAPAYIIYTSGSTGKPKGVLVTQSNLCHCLRANQAVMGFTSSDVMPTIGSQAFGASLLEILLPLVSGGAVRIVRKAQVVDLEQLLAASGDVTVLHAVPSLMRQWLATVTAAAPGQYPKLRLLLVGGEAVPAALLARIAQWRPDLRLLALYGMTEAAIVCSSFEPAQTSFTHYCIGKPYATSRFYVLNRHGQQQPPGVPGELHIGGLQVAACYVNQPGLSAERFIAAPWCSGERLYKTGDRARLLADGHYEFMGRVDHQVSLRGARIELGEIEALAGAVPGVRQAVAHVAELGPDEQTLVLFYTASAPDDAQQPVVDQLRDIFGQHLPDYMRPTLIQTLDAFPLNPNGKVDRRQLPRPAVSAAMVAPASATEQRLAEIWMALLQTDQVSVTANFFEMGGHSLLAARMVAQVRASFDVSFPLARLFASPTIRACAEVVDECLREKYADSLLGAGVRRHGVELEEMIL